MRRDQLARKREADAAGRGPRLLPLGDRRGRPHEGVLGEPAVSIVGETDVATGESS